MAPDPRIVMIRPDYIASPAEPARRVEFFAAVPQGKRPWPAVVYVHGHQHPDRPGGGAIAQTGLLERLAAVGVLGVSLSQPGYGGSSGPPDFCGPRTQGAILAIVRHAVLHLGAQPGRVAVIAGSRGAIAAAVAAAEAPELGALVLTAGVYDLAAGYRDCPWSGIRRNIEREAGTSDEAFRARSALVRAYLIRCPVLIMHGASDDRFKPEQAERFAKALAKREAPVELKIFPDEGHLISRSRFLCEAHGFVNRHLGTDLPLE
jgi:dipeptidyl aminopeptidase/acylaminoacyl peptidase